MSKIVSTLERVRTADRMIALGKPIANTQVYVLDANREPVPVGTPGELYIGGMGLARGYRGVPQLTTERFVPNPFRAGERLYRTGDFVRRRADGNLEFVRRSDNQVKIRGFRVELGEIETAVRGVEGVRDCVVLFRDGRLLGYVVRDRKVDLVDALRLWQFPVVLLGDGR